MTNMAGFRLNIGDLTELFGPVREGNLTELIVDPDILNLFLATDILYDLGEIVSGIQHHGIMGAHLDGIPQPIRFRQYAIDGPVPLDVDVEIGPNKDRDE